MKPEQVAPKDVFLKFNYPELKDLGKHFLTIASATAVFLVSFVEKIVRLPEPVPGDSSLADGLFKTTLVALLAAIVTSGIGLVTNYIAGAGASGAIIWGIGKDFRALTRLTYIMYIVAGSCPIAAYILLGTIGLVR